MRIEDIKRVSEFKIYYYEDEVFGYWEVPRQLWSTVTSLKLRNTPLWRRKIIRGFVVFDPNNRLSTYEIYIKKGTKIGRDMLIKHEIGHVLGYEHTWYPTIMNPTWLFRWLDYMP